MFYLGSDERKRKSYEGDFFDGKRHGNGTVLYQDGSFWKKIGGEFSNDVLNGYGIAEMSNGNIYKGNWREGFQSGQGTLTYAPANQWKLVKYEGEFKAGKRDGRGVLTWKDGGTYTGEFKDDAFNGQGKRVKADNSWSDEGEYRDGKLMNGTRRVVRWHAGSLTHKTYNYTVRDGKEYCCCGICPTCIIV